MNVLIITLYTPMPENYKGISGLIFHLLEKRPENIAITLYSYNINKISEDVRKKVAKDLNVEIHLLKIPQWILFCCRNALLKLINLLLPLDLLCYLPLPNMIKKEIECRKYDTVWLYPFYFFRWIKIFPSQHFVLTGCDSGALFAKRCSKDAFFNRSIKHMLSLNLRMRKARKVEKEIKLPNARIHFVGKTDLAYYTTHNNANNGFYTPHPHYRIANKSIKFSSNLLKVLWAGSNDLYMRTKGRELLDSLVKHAHFLCDKIEITFLGKGWSEYHRVLTDYGYQSQCIHWADNYVNEIIKYDIQLAPISVGTGTKGKVLDAMGNGLLCIGTAFALENISSNNIGCIEYENADTVCEILQDIYQNREKYENIARVGRDIVLKEHAPQSCSIKFFSHFK